MEFTGATAQQPQLVVVSSSASTTPTQPLIVQNTSSQPQQVYQLATSAVGHTNTASGAQIVVQGGAGQAQPQQFQQVQVVSTSSAAGTQPGVLQLQAAGGQQQQIFQQVEGQNQVIYQPQTDANAQQIQTTGSGNVVQLPASQLQGLNGQMGNVMVIFQSPQPQATGSKDRRVQIGGVQTTDVADDPPLYVNAKQYHRILKRRQARQKLEQSGRISKERKPFLHPSRHAHATNRHRGDGGRFTAKSKKSAPKDANTSANATQINGAKAQSVEDSISNGVMMNTIQAVHQ